MSLHAPNPGAATLGWKAEAKSGAETDAFDDAEVEAAAAATLSVGMAVALGALAMTFGAVLLAYGIVRVQAAAWPPPGEAGPPALWPWPLAATAAALAGSAAMWTARRRVARAAAGAGRQQLLGSLLSALAAGITFVAIQAAAWAWLVRSGVGPGSGLVASVVYGLTVFHAVHALAAVIALLPSIVRAWRKRVLRPASFGAVAALWHLVTAVWLVVLLAVFVA